MYKIETVKSVKTKAFATDVSRLTNFSERKTLLSFYVSILPKVKMGNVYRTGESP